MNPSTRSLERRRSLTFAAVIAAVLIVASCGGGERSEESAPTTSTTAADGTEVPTSPDEHATADDQASTDDVAPVDTYPLATPSTSSGEHSADDAATTTLPAQVGLPAPGEEPLNEAGEPIRLDETASLACAHGQFARDAVYFDDLDQAAVDLASAADRAEPSANPDISAAADWLRTALDSADPLAVVDEFLAICVEYGHQI